MNKAKIALGLLALWLVGGRLLAGADEKPAPAPVRVSVKKVHLIHRVEPEYPPEALKNNLQSIVVIEATTDVYGKVHDARVISGHPIFNGAALDAVKQWIYEPYLVDGVAKPVQFKVSITFTLVKGGPRSKGAAAVPPGPELPNCGQLVKKVDPVYPEAAKKDKIEGMVILSLAVDEKGLVAEAKVLNSLHPLLDRAAIDAARQWQYKPCIGPDGKGKPFACTVTFQFVLSDKKNEASSDEASTGRVF